MLLPFVEARLAEAAAAAAAPSASAAPVVPLVNAEAARRIDLAAAAPPRAYYRLNLARLGLTDADVANVDWTRVAHSVAILDLSGNALTVLPAELGCLGQLQELVAFKNRIRTVRPGLFRGTRELHTLLLSDNQLSTLPADVAKLRELRVVDLDANLLSSVPAPLSHCKALVQLSASNNPRMAASHAQMLKERTMLEHLLLNPCSVSALSMGALLASPSASSDVTYTFHCADGVTLALPLHRCLMHREALFASDCQVGKGEFAASTWQLVVRFLYEGALSCTRAEVEALAALAAAYPLDSLASLLQAEVVTYTAADAAYVALVEEAKRVEGAPVPAKPADADAYLDGSDALAAHITRLLDDDSLATFTIEACDGETRRAHLPVLEMRLGTFFGSMLHNRWQECCSGVVKFPTTPVSVVDSILEWAHTDALGIRGEVDVVALVQVAQLYAVEDLAIECRHLISEGMDVHTAPELFVYAHDACGLEWLRASSKVFIKNHWYELIEKAEFKALPAELRAELVA